jgi:glutamate-1-semialdehyde 2,1-aminomutase
MQFATPTATLSHPIGESLKSRAARVVPGGIYGHLDSALLWKGAPQFVKHAQGSHFWDVDGHEYIDMMCSWGPILHGHRHPVVEEAVARQAAMVDCGNGPTEAFVELAELLTDTVAHADWAMFAKNGSDVTTLAVSLARAHTRKRVILVAEGAYHGALPWCNPNTAGVLTSDREYLAYYTFNDLATVGELFAEHRGDVAGVIVSAFRHDASYDQELTDPAFARGLRLLCDTHDAVLIVDDVRAGFRLTTGCSWEEFDVRPDLSAWSKGIANGYPIGALLGSDALRPTAQTVFATGSFWMAGVPMAAAIATLNLLKDTDGLTRMYERGTQLVGGLRAQAAHHQLAVRVTGPVTMPYLKFIDEEHHALTERWAAEVAQRGAFVHPRHNWFLSTAHTTDDIEAVLHATDAAFATIAATL